MRGGLPLGVEVRRTSTIPIAIGNENASYEFTNGIAVKGYLIHDKNN